MSLVQQRRVRRFVPSSKYVRYNRKTKLWIRQRKRIYLLWFLYLQLAIKEGRDVDFGRYEGWGSSDEIENTKFDVWWENNWVKLFGASDKKEPLYKVETSHTKFDAMYAAYKIYSGRDLGSYKELAGIFLPFRGWSNIHSDQTIVGRYIRQAETILENVCLGKFP